MLADNDGCGVGEAQPGGEIGVSGKHGRWERLAFLASLPFFLTGLVTDTYNKDWLFIGGSFFGTIGFLLAYLRHRGSRVGL